MLNPRGWWSIVAAKPNLIIINLDESATLEARRSRCRSRSRSFRICRAAAASGSKALPQPLPSLRLCLQNNIHRSPHPPSSSSPILHSYSDLTVLNLLAFARLDSPKLFKLQVTILMCSKTKKKTRSEKKKEEIRNVVFQNLSPSFGFAVQEHDGLLLVNESMSTDFKV